MTFLYIFPHPDDESFGPGPAIARQVREGHEVHLLTLTRGGATRVRHDLDLSIDEMGDVRAKEMECVANVLGLASMEVLDLPDGGLKFMDPRDIEDIISARIEDLQPEVLITYAVTGVSGHPDHLVCHNVVKRVFCEMRENGSSVRRLALFTLVQGEMDNAAKHLRGVPPEHIGARVPFTAADLGQGHEALLCYETYRHIVEEHDPLGQVATGVAFELFDERGQEVIEDLAAGL